MNANDLPPARERENPDPEELNRPIPKVLLVLVVLLMGWAVMYIVRQSPGLGSSSAQTTAPAAVPAS